MRTMMEIYGDMIDLSTSKERYAELQEELAAFTREAVDPAILEAVKKHAIEHYEEGWDPVVEAYADCELADAIKGCTSVQDAINRLAETLDIRAEVCHDVRAAGDIVEPAPKPVPRGTTGCTCGTPPFAPPEPSDDCPHHGADNDDPEPEREPWMGYTPGEDDRPERGAIPGERYRA